MSKALLDKRGYNRRPINVAPEGWYYEESNGLHVYHSGKFICIIPWRSVRASWARAEKAKSKRSQLRGKETP